MKNIFTENPKDDPGDLHDKFKWDFDEKCMVSLREGGHVYKMNDDDKKNLKILTFLRYEIERLCIELDNIKHLYKDDKFLRPRIKLFLEIHKNNKGKNYTLNEIPFYVLKDQYEGLNKPKMRYYSNKESIGKDGNIRCKRRDIFLKLRTPTGWMSKKFIRNLILHEIAHTGCNHVQWRPDDHGDDFKVFESVLVFVANDINFFPV